MLLVLINTMLTAGAGSSSSTDMTELSSARASSGEPWVFQCRGCRTIVGDSLGWMAAEEDRRTICLQSKMEMHLDSKDIGSKIAD